MSFISTEKLKMKYENSFRIVLSTFFTTQLFCCTRWKLWNYHYSF